MQDSFLRLPECNIFGVAEQGEITPWSIRKYGGDQTPRKIGDRID